MFPGRLRTTVRNRPGNIYTGFIPTQLMTTPVAAVTVYSAPDDGRKWRPKHAEHTYSC